MLIHGNKTFEEQTNSVLGIVRPKSHAANSQPWFAPLSCYLRDLGIEAFPLRWIPSQPMMAAESLSRDDFCAGGSLCLSGSGPLCAFGVRHVSENVSKLSHQITIVKCILFGEPTPFQDSLAAIRHSSFDFFMALIWEI